MRLLLSLPLFGALLLSLQLLLCPPVIANTSSGNNKVTLTISLNNGKQSFTLIEGSDGSKQQLRSLSVVEPTDKLEFTVDWPKESASSPPAYVLLVTDSAGSFPLTQSSSSVGVSYRLKLDGSAVNAGGKQWFSLYLTPKRIWKRIGEIDFRGAVQPTFDEPADHFEPLPQITHTFRPDVELPPRPISLLFTVLCLVPWIPLLAVWFGGLGASLKGFPSPAESFRGFWSSLTFIVLLAANCGALWMYWTVWNGFQAIPILLGFGAALAVSGRYMLAYFHEKNILAM